MNNLQEWITASIELADGEQSKITEREKETFGLSSPRLRALLNNLCARGFTNYLEIGVYRGATILSAMVGNKNCKAVGIDNFKYDDREPKKTAPEGDIWQNMKSQLYDNISRYKDSNNMVDLEKLTILEGNFQEIDYSDLPNFNLCFFDVTPVNSAIYDDFFNIVSPKLANESILVFSNYSNETHAKQLDEALDRHKDKLEVIHSIKKISSGLSDATQYYSGILIVIAKKVEKTQTTTTPKANTVNKVGK